MIYRNAYLTSTLETEIFIDIQTEQQKLKFQQVKCYMYHLLFCLKEIIEKTKKCQKYSVFQLFTSIKNH